VVKGRGREIPPLVIVAWTQGVACTAWVLFFLLSGRPFVAPGPLWPAVAASCVLVLGMSGLLARASARGDISIVGPILALSPIFTIVPDAVLSGGLPSALGWIGLAFSLTGTVSLSGQGTGRHRLDLAAQGGQRAAPQQPQHLGVAPLGAGPDGRAVAQPDR